MKKLWVGEADVNERERLAERISLSVVDSRGEYGSENRPTLARRSMMHTLLHDVPHAVSLTVNGSARTAPRPTRREIGGRALAVSSHAVGVALTGMPTTSRSATRNTAHSH